MSKTEQKLSEMFKENTGRHFLDSGGTMGPDGKVSHGYGRNWERNQRREFEKEQETSVTFEVRSWDGKAHLEIDVTHNTYHWLKERLDWSEDGNKALRACARFIRAANYRDGKREGEYVGEWPNAVWVHKNGELPNQFELAEEFPRFFAAWLVRHNGDFGKVECRTCDGEGTTQEEATGALQYDVEKTCPDCDGRGWELEYHLSYDAKKGFSYDGPEDTLVGGIYGDGEPVTVNTYNEENLLDQTLQFVYFIIDRQDYVVLQVHGGCDVRGGYTDPQVFECNGNSELAIFDYARAGLGCDGESQLDDSQCFLPGVKGVIDKADAEQYHSWYTDDGHNFYGSNYEQDLKKYEVVVIDEEKFEELRKAMGAQWDRLGPLPTITDHPSSITYAPRWVKGKLCVNNEEKTAFCPHCGGKLSAGSY